MKKIFALIFLIFCVLALSLPSGGSFAVKAHAETVNGAKLEYFELNKPLAVWQEDNTVYIAEKELVVIYYNDTYIKVPLDGFNITNLAKCGNHLLILSNGGLYSINLQTNDCSLVQYPSDQTIDFANIASFAVNGNKFVINTNDRQVFLFEVTNEQDFNFSLLYTNTLTLDSSSALALSNDLKVYYYSSAQQKLHLIDMQSGMQGPYQKVNELIGIECFAFNDTFYFKANNIIYSLGSNLTSDTPQQILDLASININNAGNFFVNNNKFLICDTQSDRIVEYDILAGALTDFEISFTKINLPQSFEISFNQTPQFVTVNKDTKLYDINFKNSLQKGYFVFNGYHDQLQTQDYLVVAQISNAYYLIAGEVMALVLKEDFTPEVISQTQLSATGYITSNAKTYLLPYLFSEFSAFAVTKAEPVQTVCSFTISGTQFTLVKKGDAFGYIPSSFIVSSLQTLPEYSSYQTATTVNNQITVYANQDLTGEIGTLPALSQIVICKTSKGAYKIVYGDSYGYIAIDCVEKLGKSTNKAVFVIILLAIGSLFTALYLQSRLLYAKKTK